MGKLLVQMAFQEMLVKAKTNTSTGLANVPLVLVLAPQQSTISKFFFSYPFYKTVHSILKFDHW